MLGDGKEGGRKKIICNFTTVYCFQENVQYCVYTCSHMNRRVNIFFNNYSNVLLLFFDFWSACRIFGCEDCSKSWIRSWSSVNHLEFPICVIFGLMKDVIF